MAQLFSLYGRISPLLASKASTVLMLQKIQDTVIDFCDRTNVLQKTVPLQDVDAQLAEYPITPPDGLSLVEPLWAILDNRRIDPLSEQELDLHWRDRDMFRCGSHGSKVNDWRSASAPRPGGFYVSVETGNAVLVPIPETAYTGANGLSIRAAWKPLPDVSQIDDAIYNDYFMTLVEGAVARLMLVPSKPWTDMKGAAMHMANYEGGVGGAKASIQRNMRRNDRVAYRTKAVV